MNTSRKDAKRWDVWYTLASLNTVRFQHTMHWHAQICACYRESHDRVCLCVKEEAFLHHCIVSMSMSTESALRAIRESPDTHLTRETATRAIAPVDVVGVLETHGVRVGCPLARMSTRFVDTRVNVLYFKGAPPKLPSPSTALGSILLKRRTPLEVLFCPTEEELTAAALGLEPDSSQS